MSDLSKYDSVSERLADDASFVDIMLKYGKILQGLNEKGIHLDEAIPNPVLVDKECGFRLTHNKITWDVFRVQDVIEMIVTARDNHIERMNKENK